MSGVAEAPEISENFWYLGGYQREKKKMFGGCQVPGGRSSKSISSVMFLKNPKIEILKKTVWFVLES